MSTKQNKCVVCECSKCSCAHCRCNLHPGRRGDEKPQLASPYLRLTVDLPSIAPANLQNLLPSCVANEAMRAKCPSRIKCAFVDIKYSLLRADVRIRSVVYTDITEDARKNFKSIAIDVVLQPDADERDTARVCKETLLSRGYTAIHVSEDIGSKKNYGGVGFRATHEVAIAIEGMTCSSCLHTVSSALGSVAGVSKSEVAVHLHVPEDSPFAAFLLGPTSVDGRNNAEHLGEAVLKVDARQFSASDLGGDVPAKLREFFRARIDGLGFETRGVKVNVLDIDYLTEISLHNAGDSVADGEKTRLDVLMAGLTCASCVQSLSAALIAVSGVTSAEISLLPYQRAIVTFDSSKSSSKVISETIENVGFEIVNMYASAVVDMDFILEPNLDENEDTGFLVAHGSDKHSRGASYPNAFVETNIVEEGSPTYATTKLDVGGMTCASCVTSVERVVSQLDGVESAVVSLLTNMAVVKHDPQKVGVRRLIKEIESAGFDASLSKQQDLQNVARERSEKELREFLSAVAVTAIFAAPTVVVGMILGMALPADNPVRMALDKEVTSGVSVMAIVLWILATPVQFWIGARFYKGAWKSLRYAKSANMDVLVALGTSAAYFYSVYTVIDSAASGAMNGDQYFETSTLLIFFILIGKYLESYAKGKTGEAVTKLVGLAPNTAILVQLAKNEGNGEQGVTDAGIVKEETVPVALVEVGDILKVAVGSRFPCDGIIVSNGTTHADESMLTGEALPQAKSRGDGVTGGTLNTGVPVLIKAVHVGGDTMLARIVSCVQDAQMNKAPVQAVADRVSRVFVPTVVAIAAATFVVWYVIASVRPSALPQGKSVVSFALNFAISVLVIACPCALGLATPTAVMVGTGVAAKYGILAKGGGIALQTASRIKTIVFDKTGTLTMGKPTVTDCIVAEPPRGIPLNLPGDFYSAVSFVEGFSAHPLAIAAMSYSLERMRKIGSNPSIIGDGAWKIVDVEETAGMGLSARMTTILPVAYSSSSVFKIVIGSRKWVVETHNCPDTSVAKSVENWQNDGKTAVYVGFRVEDDEAKGGILLGVLAISDPPRLTSQETVQKLQHMGIRVIMMTGDQPATAQAVAKLVGIHPEDVIAGCMPEDKGRRVKQIRNEAAGGKVGFAGDGINDSIALANADVGIAIGGGSDIAIESASVVLLRSELGDIVTLVKLSRTVLNRIYINMGGAFVYNTLGIPIAAGVFFWAGGFVLAPWIAGLAMALSSVTVVLSSLGLKAFRPPV